MPGLTSSPATWRSRTFPILSQWPRHYPNFSRRAACKFPNPPSLLLPYPQTSLRDSHACGSSKHSFVATLLHPVFFTSGANRHIVIVEDNEHNEATANVVRSKVVTKYLHVSPWRGVAMYGQPEQQYYFHRPLHELFATFFRVGLAMDALEEPAFTEEQGKSDKIESHFNYKQLPAILAFRMRCAT